MPKISPTLTKGLGRSTKIRKYTGLAFVAVALISGYIIISARASTALPSDINNDGKVDVFDLSALLSNWNASGSTSDLNGDGTVSVFDLSILLSHWGQTSGSPSPTTTATATATPTPGTGACPVSTPHKPDGPDGMGGCWPGPASTGYPKGLPGDTRTPVTLTDYTPPTYIQQCGLVLDKKRIKGDILVTASNGTHNPNTPCVTITNSLVEGVIFGEGPENGPIVIKDTEINPGAQYIWWENLGRGNWFAWRVNSHGSEIVLKCSGYCESYDSYVHGGHLTDAYHYNAFGSNGIGPADGFFKIEHNWAECGNWETYNPPATDGGCSSDMGFYGDFDVIHHVTINKNFFAGLDDAVAKNAGVPYCLQSGYHQGKVYPTPNNLTITNNVFGRGSSNKCGAFGAATELGSSPTNVWTNNKYTDGVVIPKP